MSTEKRESTPTQEELLMGLRRKESREEISTIVQPAGVTVLETIQSVTKRGVWLNPQDAVGKKTDKMVFEGMSAVLDFEVFAAATLGGLAYATEGFTQTDPLKVGIGIAAIAASYRYAIPRGAEHFKNAILTRREINSIREKYNKAAKK